MAVSTRRPSVVPAGERRDEGIGAVDHSDLSTESAARLTLSRQMAVATIIGETPTGGTGFRFSNRDCAFCR